MSIKTIGIIGAGTMGNGIAQSCAMSGFATVMLDINDAALGKGMATISKSLDRLIKKEKVTEEEKSAIVGRIKTTTDMNDMSCADLVIEAATENEGLKLKIIRDVEKVIAPQTIIASNTSSISITHMAAATSRPDRFVGLHFFNPVPVMALVEIIRGLQTSDETHARVESLAQALGKYPITVKNNPGFVVNRILCPMINEAIFVFSEGLASAEAIDEGMKLGCNHPIGPLALADMVGLDTLLAVMQVFYEGFDDSKYRPAPLLKEMVGAGYLGRKSGRGFYTYA
ncbi:MAG TPA: 3-hydroxybutyryl-CoA dehydrogenase [Rugosibacter sp.]|jgi:3-hydroxybutyryl-CoA dehydrogenase|nr:3-hydroxybutyryl-CoA dehydrogenase [Rugosibacter sp.]MDD3380438.1 3-hydroxybutyryl-CoA dehydrogenase [Rugosibacter sp.]HPB91264.1 3-hydroxybutyryl-CoA dehydrogenase [Rugosibacter sp.]HQN46784.1 3-hydroxybutyryl-CoA dehydrogenase [Rugosibacter sp.]HQQ36424.1 3-hydroxybutyryl-CoA dehydrogenase [Rugosibacter sp.]